LPKWCNIGIRIISSRIQDDINLGKLIVMQNWEIEYYLDKYGRHPVLEFMSTIPQKAERKLLKFLDLLEEFGLELGQPLIKKLTGTDIWELRIQHSSDTYRILYFAFTGRKFVILHAFQKKSKRTPPKEIAIVFRMQEYLSS